ncbi:hypothetical protein ACFWV1_01425 [Streptomyces sp. NPDC058700]|uniref:hypothetical protein n=1 Tax=Streptomyces sp. NPDC058700 TaxID=3346607 RepID=UPI00365F11C1
MRKFATAVVAAGLFFGGMGVAVADSTHELVMKTPGAKFVGTYAWQPTSRIPSGLHVQGDLIDRAGEDGHNVYLRMKVEGYAWGRINGTQRKTVKIDKVFSDGAVLKTKNVRLQTCRDRGSLRPDNCSDELHIKRR